MELNSKLVSDLARLVVRYPPKDWNALLEYVGDETRRKQLISLIRELSTASEERRSGTSRTKARPPAISQMLEEVRRADPDRASFLEEVSAKLRDRELVPDLRSVRALAEAAGLKKPVSNKREQAVNELIRQLIEFPREDIQAIMRKTLVRGRELGKEYERWVTLILGEGPDAIAGDAGTD